MRAILTSDGYFAIETREGVFTDGDMIGTIQDLEDGGFSFEDGSLVLVDESNLPALIAKLPYLADAVERLTHGDPGDEIPGCIAWETLKMDSAETLAFAKERRSALVEEIESDWVEHRADLERSIAELDRWILGR